MTTRKFLIGIAETMKNCAEAIATLSARLRRAEQTLELDFICGRWVRSHDSLALTVRKTDAGYRLVLFYRGRVAARFDAVVRADGTAVYAGAGIAAGRIDYERGNPFIILEHLGVFYLHEADGDTAANT